MPLVASVLPPKEAFGPSRAGPIGMVVQRHTHTLGWKTIVFGGRQEGPTFPDIEFRPIAPGLWPLTGFDQRFAAAVVTAVKAAMPDLVEVHNHPEVALAIADRLPGVPVVAFLHDDPRRLRKAASVAERTELLRRLDRVVAASGFICGRLLEGIADPPKQPVVVPNCIDLTEFPPPRKKERLVLFVGSVVPEKGPDAFISAFAQAAPHLSDWHAEIIGADQIGDDGPETHFAKTVQGAADGAGVRMVGYRSHEKVLSTMSRAAVVVVPSRWDEPFGLVALEAMASRAALVCSTRGALPEIAGDAAIYADPNNVGTIASAIRLLCSNEARRVALAEAGRKRAMLYDLGVVTEQLAELRASVRAAATAS